MIDLPPDLEEKTLARFDDLVRRGRIFYDHRTEPGELVVHEGFQVRAKCYTSTAMFCVVSSRLCMYIYLYDGIKLHVAVVMKYTPS